MERDRFYTVPNLCVLTELMLDEKNPRIGIARDQNECLEHILKKTKQVMALLKDVAEYGLSIEEVVITKGSNGKWIVRDGNRRVAVLKLLNDPASCPKKYDHLRQRIIETASTCKEYPSHIDCKACDDEETVKKFIKRKHTGANEGVGQNDWSAYSQAKFDLDNGFPLSKVRDGKAVKLLWWGEENNIDHDDDFPVTTFTRMLNSDLKTIGFYFNGEDPLPYGDGVYAKNMLKHIVHDLSTKAKKVDALKKHEDRLAYLGELKALYGPHPKEETGKQEEEQTGDDTGQSSKGTQKPEPEDDTPKPTPRDRSNGAKASWERNKLIDGRWSKKYTIPRSEKKAANIYNELKKLSFEYPLSTTVLLRAFIEASTEHYMERNNIDSRDTLKLNIGLVADHMYNRGLMSEEKKKQIDKLKNDNDLLSVRTLQSFVHKKDYHPDKQVINTLYDHMEEYLFHCWMNTEATA